MHLLVFCLVCLIQLVYPTSFIPPYEPPPTGLPAPCVSPPYVIDVYNVTSTVKRRFACTRVYSEIVNLGNTSREMCFSIQLPGEAFMSGLCLEVAGRKYSGVVQEKETARQTHEENVRTGVSSGLVESRGMDKFRVCLSAGPGMRATFSVEYQQLLIMRLGTVKHTISIQPTQPVPYLSAEIKLYDSLQPGTAVSNEGILSYERGVTKCTFRPTIEEQRAISCDRGVSVDLETSYRPPVVSAGVGEGSLSGGYFVQFFSPTSGLDCICQRFIFVIDKSGSMGRQKMQQAKDAALHLLRSLKETDYFNIIAFNSGVDSFQSSPVLVGEYRDSGIRYVSSLHAGGATNINAAALSAVRQLCGAGSECVSQITLLSDGQATAGVINPIAIANNVRTACPGSAISLNCLSFGRGADHALMQTLAYGNGGRAQRIYEGQDADAQLVDFLQTVLCPLLSNIQFFFPGGSVRNVSVTSFPSYYRGDELLVSGERDGSGPLSFQVLAFSSAGAYEYRGEIETRVFPQGDRVCLEGQLHAYQLIRQSLEELTASPEAELAAQMKQRILSYALQFRFVTDLTSLLVSPLTAPECDCPSSCACSPRACGIQETGGSGPDKIKLNPSIEETDTNDNSYNRAIPAPLGIPGPSGGSGASSLVRLTNRIRTTTTRRRTTTTTTADPTTTTTTTADPTTTTTADPTTTTVDPTTTTTANPTTTTTADPTTTTTADPTTTTTADPTTTTTAVDPTTTTTADPTTTTLSPTSMQSDCGDWRNLTSCTRGTANHIQFRCGTCTGLKRVRRVRCGLGYKGHCYSGVRSDGTAFCMRRKHVLTRRLVGRILFSQRRCERIPTAPSPPLACQFQNGVCSIKS